MHSIIIIDMYDNIILPLLRPMNTSHACFFIVNFIQYFKVGLAVDDIKGILETAEVTRIESKV